MKKLVVTLKFYGDVCRDEHLVIGRFTKVANSPEINGAVFTPRSEIKEYMDTHYSEAGFDDDFIHLYAHTFYEEFMKMDTFHTELYCKRFRTNIKADFEYESTFEDKIEELINSLIGTCKSISNFCEEIFGCDEMDLPMKVLEEVDNAIFECEGCGWWYDRGEEGNQNGFCSHCCDSEDYSDDEIEGDEEDA